MARCVIIGAAEIKNYSRVKEYLRPDDYYIFCDGGLLHQKALEVSPNLIVGDFDSYRDSLNFDTAEIIQLPREKDDTDLFYAVKHAISKGFDDFLLLGASGGRLDHTLCNVSVLLYLFNRNKSALLLDDYSEMEIVGKTPHFIPDKFSYFSIMCPDGNASGICITDAKYPLENATLRAEEQYAISNEVLPNKTAKMFVNDGHLLLIKVF